MFGFLRCRLTYVAGCLMYSYEFGKFYFVKICYILARTKVRRVKCFSRELSFKTAFRNVSFKVTFDKTAVDTYNFFLNSNDLYSTLAHQNCLNHQIFVLNETFRSTANSSQVAKLITASCSLLSKS